MKLSIINLLEVHMHQFAGSTNTYAYIFKCIDFINSSKHLDSKLKMDTKNNGNDVLLVKI